MSDGAEAVERIGGALEALDPGDLKLLAVIRHLMDEHDADIITALAMIDEQSLEDAMTALWRCSGLFAAIERERIVPDVLHVESMVGTRQAGKPLVKMQWRSSTNGQTVEGLFDLPAAQHHGLAVLEAAEAAASDAVVYEIVRAEGGSHVDAVQRIRLHREVRDRWRRERGEPETFGAPASPDQPTEGGST